MASTAARPAFLAGGRRFRLGNKKVYLPPHIITLVAPSRNQPPTLCTFQVPMPFNKLDMRDYLFNLYNLPTLSIRSFINPTKPKRRTAADGAPVGPWRRQAFKKMMTVELVRPFHYPSKPADLEPWDQSINDKIADYKEDVRDAQMRDMKGRPARAGERKVDAPVLARAAEKVMAEGWSNGVVLDERWRRIQAAERARGQKMRG